MVTCNEVKTRIEQYLEGFASLDDLVAWAEQAFREETFEQEYAEQIQKVLSVLRDAADPHRFRWEEPEWDTLLETLES